MASGSRLPRGKGLNTVSQTLLEQYRKPVLWAIYSQTSQGQETFSETRGYGSRMWPNQRVPSQFGRLPRCWAGPAPSCPPLLQECHVWVGWLPADGQQADDDNGRGELVHAFLDDDAVDGPASVVGQEGLTCGGDRAGSARGAHSRPSLLTQPEACSSMPACPCCG